MSESTAQSAVEPQSAEAPRPGAARLMSDSRLSRRAADGDQRAFAAIFHRYHQDLYRYCVAILGDSQDAQDALQNTMVKVLTALPGEQREIRLKPWLYRIAHNEAIDLRRGQRPTEALDAEIPLVEAEPAQAIETRDRVRRLVGDIGMLPERQRGALVMRELSDLSFEQIGAAFGTSAAVARQTVYEARLSLQQMSEGREMDCAAVTKALSDGDGRLLRRRDMRAHLRSCAECRGFEDGLKDRQRDLAAIAPLPAVMAAGLLQGLLGGAGAGGGVAGGAAAGGGGALAGAGAATGKTVAGTVLAKSAATVAVVAVVGVSAADRSGLVNVGLPSGGSSNGAQQTPAGSPGSSPPASPGQAGSASPQDGAGAGQQSQLQEGKALKSQAGTGNSSAQSTAGGKGNEEAKGQSEAHQEAQHGNGPPAAVPNNQGRGNSSGHGNRGAAAGSHSQAGGHSKGGAHSQAGTRGQGASSAQGTGKAPSSQAAPAKQPKSHGTKSASPGKAHSKGSSRGASTHHSSSAGTRRSHSHPSSKPQHGRSESASSPAAEESAQQTAAP